MKKEKIIANIESYVKTLREKEQLYYYSSLENAGDAPIKKAFPNVGEPIFELAEIVQELKREIKEQAQKETKGNSFVKRSKLITKLLEKSYDERSKKGIIEEINGEELQCCIIDGYYAFAFRERLDIPMIEAGTKQPFALQKVLPNYNSFEVRNFDIAEIKTTLKMHKAAKKKEACIIDIGEKCYNAKYFIDVIDGLGGDIKLYQNKNTLGIDVFESENGIALLCPCRKTKNI